LNKPLGGKSATTDGLPRFNKEQNMAKKTRRNYLAVCKARVALAALAWEKTILTIPGRWWAGRYVKHYNEVRLNSVIGYVAPAEFSFIYHGRRGQNYLFNFPSFFGVHISYQF
jgi:hypothetical protein